MKRLLRIVLVVVGAAGTYGPLLPSQEPRLDPHDALVREVFKELVEINTSALGGNVSLAARTVAARLARAGYSPRDVRLVGPAPTCLNVVGTLRGRDAAAKGVLLMAHLDVVAAKRSDWKFDPYRLREADGVFYGRGTLDNKAGAAVLVANMIRWKRERFVPARSVILVLTCDEETTAEGGIRWLLAKYPELSSAEYALNSDAGAVTEQGGKPMAFAVDAAEKVYATFELTARNPGGHSSTPRPDNAIYTLAAGISRLRAHRFPVVFNEITRANFERSAAQATGDYAAQLRAAARGDTSGPLIDGLSQRADDNAQLRTTCVATMLAGGHAENALPQSATATVNCRMMPGSDVRDVQRTLERVVGDTALVFTLTYSPTPSPPSPLRPDVFAALESLAREFWPGAPVIPAMSTGATDGLYVRNVGVPVYGVSALQFDPEQQRAHGLDESVPVRSLYRAAAFWYRLVKELAGVGGRAS